MLQLPQLNNSRIRIPNIPNYRRLLEAYGFDVKQREPTTLLMERNAPDNNRYEGAWQERAAVPLEFETEVQRAIQII